MIGYNIYKTDRDEDNYTGFYLVKVLEKDMRKAWGVGFQFRLRGILRGMSIYSCKKTKQYYKIENP